jgi:hypothetical protein
VDHYTAALRECRKVVYWLSLLIDSGVKDDPALRGLYAEGGAIAKLLSVLVAELMVRSPSLKKKRDDDIDSGLREL